MWYKKQRIGSPQKANLGLAIMISLVSICGLVIGDSMTASATRPSSEPMNIYYGTTHMHTGADNDHGGDSSHAADIFKTAKANAFDFVMLTEHSGPTGPKDSAKYYASAKADAASITKSSSFVGLVGYEYSENGGDGDSDSGHMTGYGTTDYVNASAPGMKFSTFMMLLAKEGGFGGFNHPPASGHPASVAANLTVERRGQIVMTEASRNASYDTKDESDYYKGMVAELDRGWRVAPTCGLDGHGLFAVKQVETASKKPCRTGLLAPSLSKTNVLSALKERRIYATRDVNMAVKYSVNNYYWMGSQVGKPTKATFNIDVSDPDTSNSKDKITKIEVIGNGGEILATQKFSAHTVNWKPSVTVGSNKYMFVRVFNGERTAHTAVAAPVWFEAGGY